MKLIRDDGTELEFDGMLAVHIAKAETDVEIDVNALSVESFLYGLNYGFRQSLNDAAAAIGKDEENVAEATMGLVNKRRDAILNGSVKSTGGRIGDSVKVRAIAIAVKHAPKGDAKAKRAWALNAIGENVAFMILARKQIEEEKLLEI